MLIIRPKRGENPYAKTAVWVACCDLCGERFTRQKNRLEQSKGCFCAIECKSEFKKREKYGWHCPRCGESLEDHQTWCSSKECIEANSDWEDTAPIGKTRYCIRVESIPPLPYTGKLWKQKRREALERDDFECKICSVTQRKHRSHYGSGLHVHHKTPRRQFDTAAEAHRLDNLVTLCCRCHRRTEANDDRVDVALSEVRPLDDLREEEIGIQIILDRLERLENEVGLE